MAQQEGFTQAGNGQNGTTSDELAGASSDWSESPTPNGNALTPTTQRPTAQSESPSYNNQPTSQPSLKHLFVSTLLSLGVVLVLLICLRYLLPPMLESSRYSWQRGFLRAEYEESSEQLARVSWDGLAQVSELVNKRVNPSVVHITISNQQALSSELMRKPVDMMPKAGPNRETRRIAEDDSGMRITTGQGSGIIVSERGHILTNHHVLEGGVEITVYLPDQRVLPAEIIGVDRTTDLALLQVDATDLIPIVWGDSDEAQVGSPVWAVGSPFGLTGSISFGILSGKHRVDLNANPQYRRSRERISSRYSDLMQTDVAVNPGNSGGPLVNGRGEVIGITTAIIGESYRGVSFAIPSRLAKDVYAQFLEHGRVRRGWMGVEMVPQVVSGSTLSTEGGADGLTTSGVVIRAVLPDSPAARAGLAPGDRVLSIGGEEIVTVEQAIDTIRDTPAGQRITIVCERDAMSIALEVELGELNFAP